MAEPLEQLPEGWAWTRVGDVIEDAQAGFSSGKKDVPGGLPHLRMNNITSACVLDLAEVRTVPRELAKPRHYLKRNDVLVCHTNSVKLVGKTAIYEESDGERAFSNHLTRLRVTPDVIDPRWLWRALTLLWRDRYFETRCKKWVNQATIERDVLLAAPIPLPPLPEQQRLVEKIERLLEQSRTAREALDRIPPLVNRFRQSVLAKAFRGELTERDPNDEPASVLLERVREERRRKWEEGLRAKGKDPRKAKYVEPEPPDTSGLPELPEGWAWATVAQSADVRLGRQRSPSKSYGPHMTPYLRAANVTWKGLDLRDVNQMEFTPSEQVVYRLQTGDVVLSEASGSASEAGKPAIWRDEIPGCCFQNTLIRVRSAHAPPEYLRYHFLDDAMSGRFAEATTGIGINHLGANGLSQSPIALAPLREQRRIVETLDAHLARVDAIEAAITSARRRAENVDQAVLAQVFRGEL